MGLYILISVLILIACVFMVLIVLVQNAKGGGLASNFSSNNQVMGVRKTTDFLEKATWTLAIILGVLALSSTFVIPRTGTQVQQSEVRDLVPAQQLPQTQFPVAEPLPAQPDATQPQPEVEN